MSMSKEDAQEINEHFKFVCRKCGSDDVVLNVESEGFMGSSWTGWCEGTWTIGCNCCKQNDHMFDN